MVPMYVRGLAMEVKLSCNSANLVYVTNSKCVYTCSVQSAIHFSRSLLPLMAATNLIAFVGKQ